MKRTRIKPISKKKAKQMRQERILEQEMLVQSGGLCNECHQPPDFRGLSKHEIVSRAQGGDPTDRENCDLLCGRCHSAKGGIKEVA